MQSVLSDEQLIQLLRDDVPYGDLTTELLLDLNSVMSMTYAARQPMTLCGIEEVVRLFQIKGATAKHLHFSGARLDIGDIFLHVSGTTDVLFEIWKVAQTLLEWASGIASDTYDLVVQAGDIPVACTRKHIPFTKQLAVKAVRAGGGIIHRFGLSESILIFAEHRQFLKNETPHEILSQLGKAAPEQMSVVEVHTLEDAKQWIDAGAPVVQLDKFTPEQVALLSHDCELSDNKVLLAVAGGVNRKNIAAYVKAGAKLIVTSSPYHAKPKDVQVYFHSVLP